MRTMFCFQHLVLKVGKVKEEAYFGKYTFEVFVFNTNLAFLYNIDIEGFLKSFNKK